LHKLPIQHADIALIGQRHSGTGEICQVVQVARAKIRNRDDETATIFKIACY
jgi:hypothetical protein